jgi:uncharacterized membrane protein
MEVKLNAIVLLFGIVCTGLTAGLCFTWHNAVTPGIGLLDDLSFLKSFQAMNRAIINKTFLIVFFSPTLLLFLSAYLFKEHSVSFWLILSAAVLFLVGMTLVTIFGNVPLNEILDKVDLETLSKVELETLRQKFEQPWNQWHTIRTVSAVTSFILLLIGLVSIK